jgi:hypothetical protein
MTPEQAFCQRGPRANSREGFLQRASDAHNHKCCEQNNMKLEPGSILLTILEKELANLWSRSKIAKGSRWSWAKSQAGNPSYYDCWRSVHLSVARPLEFINHYIAMKTLPRYLRRGALAAFCSCLTFFFALPSRAQTLFLNFNTPGQYAGNFNQWNDNGAGADGGNYSFQESVSGGVGNSGYVSVFRSFDMTATYENGSWDFSTNGATILLSVEIQADGQSSGDKVQFGIMDSHTNGFNNNPGVSFESYRFIPSSATVWSLREQYRNSNALTETILGNVSVTVGHWYKFMIGLTNTSGATGQYNSGCALYDYGVDGLSPETNVISFSTAETHSAGQTIATLSAVWPGLRAYEDGGIDAWDNFSVFTPSNPPVPGELLVSQPLGDQPDHGSGVPSGKWQSWPKAVEKLRFSPQECLHAGPDARAQR